MNICVRTVGTMSRYLSIREFYAGAIYMAAGDK